MKIFGAHIADRTSRIFVIALLWSIFAIVFYSYTLVTVYKTNGRVESLLRDVGALSTEKAELASLQGKAEETVLSRKKLVNYFIAPDGVVSFLNELERLGAENNLTLQINSVSVEDEPTVPERFEYLKLKAEAKGNWSDIYRLTAILELMPLKIVVDMVDLQNVAKDAGRDAVGKKESPRAGWKGEFDVRVLKLK